MSHVMVDRGGWSDQLCAALGLAEQPALEWHTWAQGTVQQPVLAGDATGWRYLDTADTNPAKAAPGYDDSGWATGRAPFGWGDLSGVGFPVYTLTTSPFHVWARRSFTSAGGDLTLTLNVDQRASVWLDGTQLLNDSTSTVVTVPAAAGAHTLAVYAYDTTGPGGSFVRVAVTEAVPAFGWTRDPDRTAALSAYTTSYGRQAVTEAAGPLAATVRLVPQLLAGRLPTVGERFRLTVAAAVAEALTLPEADRPRFTGEVTDADVDPEGYLQVVGVGLRARALTAPVGADHYPTESASARVARVLAEVSEQVPAPFAAGAVDSSTQQLLRREAGLGPAAAVLEQAQTDTAGQLVEQRDGTLEWHGPDHRRGATSAVTLAGTVELLRPFRWAQGIGDVVNDAVVTYGRDQRRVRVTDETSADLATGLGLRTVELSTELADPASAYALGTDLVGRRAWPTWRLPEVTVELIRSARPKLVTVLGLRHGDLVTLQQLPAGGPYTGTDAFVEGVTETADRTSWALTLSVADPALSGVSMRWIDVPAGVTWADVPEPVTWLRMATITEAELLDWPTTTDGGTATAVHTDTADGGTATAVHTDTLDAGDATP